MKIQSQYEKMRTEFEVKFCEYSEAPASRKRSVSDSGKYELVQSEYSNGLNSWGYSRGRVINLESGIEIYDVKRNFGRFWHTWVSHENGNEYLLCGEDYQGYLVINLTEGKINTHFPKEGYSGGGFCWANVLASPDRKTLAVEGCFWACPYELVLYDFSDPDTLPLPELKRVQGHEQSIGWKSNAIYTAIVDPEENGENKEIDITVEKK
jgi:hypothetical protein